VDNIKRAWSDTWRSIKRRGIPELLWAAGILVATDIAARESKTMRHALGPELDALIATAIVATLYLLVLFGHHLHLASARALIETLQSNADSSVADARTSEAERTRELREWVGVIQGDVRDARAQIDKWTERGYFWDPNRANYRFSLPSFVRSSGALAGDPATEPAHRACDQLRREMKRVNELVRTRYAEGFNESGLHIPYLFLYSPEVRGEDAALLTRIAKCCDAVDATLSDAMEALTP